MPALSSVLRWPLHLCHHSLTRSEGERIVLGALRQAVALEAEERGSVAGVCSLPCSALQIAVWFLSSSPAPPLLSGLLSELLGAREVHESTPETMWFSPVPVASFRACFTLHSSQHLL